MGKYWLNSFLALLAVPTAILAQNASNTYDYIVVGSGPGGGPLAANLAKAGYKTLLLEAGDDQGETLAQEVAQFSTVAYNDPLARWDFFVKNHSNDTIDDKYNHMVWKTTDGQFYVGLTPPAGAKKLGIYYPRAGTLGGCSTHNAGCAALPANTEWDEIMNLTGDPSWSYKNMRKYLVQLENNTYVPKNTSGHGFDGFLQISVNSNESLMNQTEANTIMKAAAKMAGQDPNKFWEYMQRDLNSDRPGRDEETGWFGFPGHRDLMGRRVSARDAVVKVNNALNADGTKKYPLTLSLYSLGTKVIFDKVNKTKAIGMEYLKGQSLYAADPRYNASNTGVAMQAFARKEVIIAGGTFNSPQILMLSGIGPKAQLNKFNIPVLIDLPGVGAQLQDNTEFGLIAKANVTLTNIGMDSTCTFGAVIPGVTDHCLEAWKQGKGPYAQGPVDSLMLRSSVAYKNERDIFIFAIPAASFQGYWPAATVNEIPPDSLATFDFSMVKMRPNNKLGTVTLTSASPRDVPSINFRFFEEGAETDIQALADAVDFGRKALDSIAAPIGPFTEVLPCSDGTRDCDVKEIIREQAWSHHATSTCAIGADNDTMAVLDSSFRVRGTQGLRVVDASVFPRTPGAFPVLPTFMLAYKATEVILKAA